MNDKATKITISVPANLAKAAENFAAVRTGGNLSRVFAEALRAHLEANGALPKPEDDERQSVLSGLAEAYSLDELRGILSRRTADQVAATPNN